MEAVVINVAPEQPVLLDTVNVKVHGVMVPASTLRLTSTTAEAAATFARTGSSVPATNVYRLVSLLTLSVAQSVLTPKQVTHIVEDAGWTVILMFAMKDPVV